MQVAHLDGCSHTEDDVQEEGHVHLWFDACDRAQDIGISHAASAEGTHAQKPCQQPILDAPCLQNSIRVSSDARMTSKLLTAMITAQPTTPTYSDDKLGSQWTGDDPSFY
jgi:hypothetical protein